MNKISCGIDPGVSGGFCIIVDGRINGLYTMPIFITESIKNNKKKNTKHLDIKKILEILSPMFKNNKPDIYIEEITHLFGLPSSSNFKLGYACGVIHGALQTLGDFYLVGPKKWQQIWDEEDKIYMKNKDGTDKLVTRGKGKVKKLNTKATSLACARRLYPDHDLLAPYGRVPHDGCIDALLIATYGSKL